MSNTVRRAEDGRSSARVRAVARTVGDAVYILTGLVVASIGSFAFIAEPDLPVVDPRDMQVAPRLDEVFGEWWLIAALVAIAVVACAGPPRRAQTGAVRSALAQVTAAALIVLAVVAASVLTSIWVVGPEGPCRYASCWPAEEQAVAIAVPGLVTATALVVATVLHSRVSWWVRALAPAAVWTGSVLVLRLLWRPWLLPVLLSPPP